MTLSSMRTVQLCDVRVTFSERLFLSVYRTIFMEKNIFLKPKVQTSINLLIIMKEIAKLRTLKHSQHSYARQKSLQKEPKSFNSRYMERPWAFSISNRKKEQLQRIRQMQIDFQQKALNGRMAEIKQKRKHSQYIDSQNAYLRQPFHENIRKQHFRIIKEQNLTHRKRVENSRGTINLKNLQKDWTEKQHIRQFVSKHERSNRRKSISHSIEISQDWAHQEPEKIRKYEKEREINGTKIILTIEEYHHVVMIYGTLTLGNLKVVMVVDRRKLDKILQEKCKGKLENFIDLFDFDPQTTSLYYITADPSIQDEFISDICSEFDLTNLKKAIAKQHLLVAHLKNKEENPSEKSQNNEKLMKNETPQTNNQETKHIQT